MAKTVGVQAYFEGKDLLNGLDQVSKSANRVREQFGRVGSGARQLSGVISGLGAIGGQTGQLLGTMLSGLAFGGPMGLAIAGVQALVGHFQNLKEEAAKASAETKKLIDAIDAASRTQGMRLARADFVAGGGNGQGWDRTQDRLQIESELQDQIAAARRALSVVQAQISGRYGTKLTVERAKDLLGPAGLNEFIILKTKEKELIDSVARAEAALAMARAAANTEAKNAGQRTKEQLEADRKRAEMEAKQLRDATRSAALQSDIALIERNTADALERGDQLLAERNARQMEILKLTAQIAVVQEKLVEAEKRKTKEARDYADVLRGQIIGLNAMVDEALGKIQEIDGRRVYEMQTRELPGPNTFQTTSPEGLTQYNADVGTFAQLESPAFEQAGENVDALKQKMQELATIGEQVGTAIGNVFVGIATGSMTAGQAMAQLLGTMWQLLSQYIIKSITAKAADAAAGAAASQSAIPVVGPALAVAAMSAMMAAVMGLLSNVNARAMGGRVDLNSPYIVGERGPELFVPGASGFIVPNHALAGVGGAAGQTVYNNFILNERGFQREVRRAARANGRNRRA